MTWNSVSSNLPPTGKPVLVYVKGRDPYFHGQEDYMAIDRIVECFNDFLINQEGFARVTHWQNLPEKPR